MVVTLIKPFNFIAASQIENLVISNLRVYLIDFLYNIKTLKKLLEFTIPIITSNLLFNSHLLNIYYKLIIAIKH